MSAFCGGPSVFHLCLQWKTMTIVESSFETLRYFQLEEEGQFKLEERTPLRRPKSSVLMQPFLTTVSSSRPSSVK